MSLYALIQNGVVADLVIWDGAAKVDFGSLTAVKVDATVQIGFSYDGTKFTAPAPPTPAPPTPAQQAMNAIGAGLTVTSTSTPALNGTYEIDPISQGEISAVINYILVNNDFPGGVGTYPWSDMSGAFHVFPNVAIFKQWATAVANYVAQLKLYASGAPGVTLPASSITIA